jgi:hypothetical protein
MHAFGSLAQLVEQRTFNPLVAGSNPARPTTNLQHQIKALRVIVTPFLCLWQSALLPLVTNL